MAALPNQVTVTVVTAACLTLSIRLGSVRVAMVVVLVTVLDHDGVQGQLLEQAHDLVVIAHVVPGEAQVLLVFL